MSDSNMQKMQSASGYTPTTEEVRGAYQGQLIKVGDNAYQLIDENNATAEFDRWLAEVKADVWDEGFSAQVWSEQSRNPYRQGENK